MKISPQQFVQNLRNGGLNAQASLTLAEASLKSVTGGKQGWTYADLPNYLQLAQDSHYSDSMRKQLIQMERDKPKQLAKLQGFYSQVVGILKKQVKA
jgi:hypothetical protein